MYPHNMKSIGVAALVFSTFIAWLHPQIRDGKSLTLDGARQVIAAAQSEARKLQAPGGVVAVVDEGGNLVALERFDDTFPAGATISIGKARTAALFKRPTKVFEEVIRNGRTSMVALQDFTPLQGGVPITYAGKVIGGVGVSGAASAEQDEQLALAGAKALETLTSTQNGSSAPLGVTFFDHQTVAAAFQQGKVLVDGANGRRYMVHASRREKPGSVEVHERDTDIIYVQDGSATLVTGGTLKDGKPIEPGEIRGTAVEGGEPRRITKGDLIIVPNGVPHWFKEVDAPFTYYVVKSRE